MKKELIIGILLMGLFFISACVLPNNKDIEETGPAVEEIPSVSYDICDKWQDIEVSTISLCENAQSDKIYMQTFNCFDCPNLYFDINQKFLAECGGITGFSEECKKFSEYNCNLNENLMVSICNKMFCGDNICQDEEDCNNCPEDCLKSGEICCDKSTINDNIAITDIITKLVSITGTVGPTPIKVSQVTDITSNNFIIVGNPCKNALIAKLMGLSYPTCGSDMNIEENTAIIQLISIGNENAALIVAGYSDEDTLRASLILKNYEQYDLKGSKMVV